MPLNDLQHVPGANDAPAETHGFVFNHTMLRVKDATQSLDFYTRVLGFRLLDARDFADAKFSLYFLALLPEGTAIPDDDAQRRLWMAGIPGVLELTHNHGRCSHAPPSDGSRFDGPLEDAPHAANTRCASSCITHRDTH